MTNPISLEDADLATLSSVAYDDTLDVEIRDMAQLCFLAKSARLSGNIAEALRIERRIERVVPAFVAKHPDWMLA